MSEQSAQLQGSWNRQQMADRHGVSVRTIDEETRAGKIPHLRLGARVVYPVDVVIEWERTQALSRLKPSPAPLPAAPRRRPRRVLVVEPNPQGGGDRRVRPVQPVRPEDAA